MKRFIWFILTLSLLPVSAFASRDSTSTDTTVVAVFSQGSKTRKVLLIRAGAWLSAIGRVEVDTLKSRSGATIVLQGNFTDAAGTQQNFSHVQIDSFSSDSMTVTGNGVVTGNFAIQGGTTIGNASGDALTFHPAAWTLTNAVTVTGTWTNLGTVTTADINGGTIDGTIIGGAFAAAGTFTTLKSDSFNVDSGGLVYSPGLNRLGIGIALPLYDLHVKNASLNSLPRIALENDAQRYSFVIRGDDADKLEISDDTAGVIRWVMDVTGNFGFGVPTPLGRVHSLGHIIGTTSISIGSTDSTLADVGYFYSNATLAVPAVVVKGDNSAVGSPAMRITNDADTVAVEIVALAQRGTPYETVTGPANNNQNTSFVFNYSTTLANADSITVVDTDKIPNGVSNEIFGILIHLTTREHGSGDVQSALYNSVYDKNNPHQIAPASVSAVDGGAATTYTIGWGGSTGRKIVFRNAAGANMSVAAHTQVTTVSGTP